jgi:hypothetical protein
MAVDGGYLAMRAQWSARPFVKAYGQWVNEHIISIATDFDERAGGIQEQTYARLSAQADPETYAGDGSEFHERAFDASLSFYETMVSLYQATVNLFTAGLFHLIEQQLADLTHDGAMDAAAPDTQLTNIVEYYRDHLNVDLTEFDSWDVIEEMRLVANATKHGEGPSAEKLRGVRPELFQYPALRVNNEKVGHFPLELPLGGECLYITADDFRRYEEAASRLFDFVIEQFDNNRNEYFPR